MRSNYAQPRPLPFYSGSINWTRVKLTLVWMTKVREVTVKETEFQTRETDSSEDEAAPLPTKRHTASTVDIQLDII